MKLFMGPGGVPPGQKKGSPKWAAKKVTTIWQRAPGTPIRTKTKKLRNDASMTFPEFGEVIPTR